MRDDTSSLRDDGAESLSVQVAGGKGEPEKLYVLTRPRAGIVEVREFRFGSHQSEPLVYAASCESLLTSSTFVNRCACWNPRDGNPFGGVPHAGFRALSSWACSGPLGAIRLQYPPTGPAFPP